MTILLLNVRVVHDGGTASWRELGRRGLRVDVHFRLLRRDARLPRLLRILRLGRRERHRMMLALTSAWWRLRQRDHSAIRRAVRSAVLVLLVFVA